jgi:peptide chain release factor 2
MIDIDLSDEIRALRSTFADIRAVVGVERLEAEIADLNEQAGAADLWDDTENAQRVTSALSHRQADLAKVIDIERRLDDIEVLVEMANEAGDEASAAEARSELADVTKLVGDLEIQTLLNGEYDALPAVITIRAGAGGVDAAEAGGGVEHLPSRFVWDACHWQSS